MSGKSTDNRSASGGSSEAPRRPAITGGEPAGSREASAPGSKPEDVALVCGISDDGQGVEILRRRGERLESGTVRRLQPGKPIHGEVVRLRPREQMPLLCDVEVELPAPRETSSMLSSGPAQVATDSYRKNWDAVYGNRRMN